MARSETAARAVWSRVVRSRSVVLKARRADRLEIHTDGSKVDLVGPTADRFGSWPSQVISRARGDCPAGMDTLWHWAMQRGCKPVERLLEPGVLRRGRRLLRSPQGHPPTGTSHAPCFPSGRLLHALHQTERPVANQYRRPSAATRVSKVQIRPRTPHGARGSRDPGRRDAWADIADSQSSIHRLPSRRTSRW